MKRTLLMKIDVETLYPFIRKKSPRHIDPKIPSHVGWGGDVDVRENLQHIRMLRNFLGGVGWGGDVDVRENLQHIRMLRNLGWVGWGGDIDVRENLQHIRMLRNFLGGVGWVPFLAAITNQSSTLDH